MKIFPYLKQKIQLIGIILVICFNLLSQILSVYHINWLWFGIIHNTLIYLILFVMIYAQRNNLTNNNIDFLSIILLLLFPAFSDYSNISIGLQDLLGFINLAIAIVFAVIFKKNKNKEVVKFSVYQLLYLLLGLILGLSIAVIKVQFSHSGLLMLAFTHPLQFIYSILLSLSFIGDEFLFRGFLWGYLRVKGIKDNWIIVITALLWGLVQINVYNNLPELINIIIFGIIIGFLVKKTKSINASLGARSGYSVFLILQKLIIG